MIVPKPTNTKLQTCIYSLAIVFTSTYLDIPVYTRSNIEHTSTYYWLVCTSTVFIWSSKKVQTKLEPVIFCILFVCLAAALLQGCRHCRHHVLDMKHTEISSWCPCTFCSCACQLTWLLMTDRRRLSRCALTSCHNVPRRNCPGWARVLAFKFHRRLDSSDVNQPEWQLSKCR
jgi:hypothetical protein